MTPRLLLGTHDGVGRVRFAKPGFDVTSNLTNEQLVYDSAWSEILNVHAMNLNTGVMTPGRVNSGSFSKFIFQMGFPTLPWPPLAVAWVFNDNTFMQGNASVNYPRVYAPAPVTITNNVITVTAPSTISQNYRVAYYVFNKPLFQADPRETDNGGSNGVLIGNHPSRGSGMWISRRGADVLTCGDDDLTLSTLRPVLQVRESGSVWSGGLDAGGYITGTFNTSQNYPDYPPVIIRGTNEAWGDPVVWRQQFVRYAEFAWVNSNTVRFRMKGGSADTLRWTILDYDSSYVPGADDAQTPRVLVNQNGLFVSKRNVDVRSAGEGDLLLRTDRSVMHVAHRQQWMNPSGGASSGSIPLNTNTAGPPITFFGFTSLGENYCRITGLDLNVYVTDWFPTGAAPATTVQARVAGGNQVIYSSPSGYAGAGFFITAIDHS